MNQIVILKGMKNRFVFFAIKIVKCLRGGMHPVHTSENNSISAVIIEYATESDKVHILKKILSLKNSGHTIFYDRICLTTWQN